jgi:ribosomal protein S18 acetylase RimI-like enzyme
MNNVTMLEIREGQQRDFDGIEAFVSDAISEAFYKPGLTKEEIQSNKRITQIAYTSLIEATEVTDKKVFIAKVYNQLAGFTILKDLTTESPEIDWLIVARNFHGKGVAQGLMNTILSHITSGKNLKLAVIHYNERAKAFYRKYGFIDTGRISKELVIPRVLMVRHVS